MLLENPNHAGGAWRPYHEESESESDDESDDAGVEPVDDLIKGLRATVVA